MKDHTIAGRVITVEIDHLCDPDEPTDNNDSPIESTNRTCTELMDVNDDCLRVILALLTAGNLCSLVELSGTYKNIRLREITDEIFRRKYTVCNLDKVVHSMDETQRVLINFGPLISDLTLTALCSRGYGVRIIKSIIQRCSGTLKSLILSNFYFDQIEPKAMFPRLEKLEIVDCDFKGATHLFANCESLVELTVSQSPGSPLNEAIFQYTFPKLESFCGEWDSESSDRQSCKNFVLRHKNLKTIMLSNPNDLALVTLISGNCSQLRKFYLYSYRNENPVEYENAVKSVSSLKQLEELTIVGDPNALIFIRQLTHLQSLKCLTLDDIRCTLEIVSALTQLKMLEKLDIEECEEFINFDAVAELCRLKELSISGFENVDFDLVHMVSRLTDLEKLNLHFGMDYKIDAVMYTRIVMARLNAGIGHRTLQIGCNGIKTVFPSQID